MTLAAAVQVGFWAAIVTVPAALAIVGAVSFLIHNRTPPNTLAQYGLWVCRGVAYGAFALLGGIAGLFALVGAVPPSAVVAIIIGFALLGLRMRGTHIRDDNGGVA